MLLLIKPTAKPLYIRYRISNYNEYYPINHPKIEKGVVYYYDIYGKIIISFYAQKEEKVL